MAPSQKRLKFVPPSSDVFTVSRVKYPSETSGDLATGMSVTMAVVFQAPSFADFDDAITFVTEEGSFKLPLSAASIWACQVLNSSVKETRMITDKLRMQL